MRRSDREDSPEDIDVSFLSDTRVILVTLVRFLAAISILVDPLKGLFLTYIFDILDAQVLLHWVKISRKQYHIWDKNIDWLAYIAELWVGAQYGVFLPLFLLLFYRFIGHFMFIHTHRPIVYLAFPNLFEVAYMWLVIFVPQGQASLLTQALPWATLWLLFLAKELHEVLLHYVWPRVLPRLTFLPQ
ncbi:MAG: hypothetical protein Q7S76_04280 [bacterium]|nr:hypothetical protein [bacterium]